MNRNIRHEQQCLALKICSFKFVEINQVVSEELSGQTLLKTDGKTAKNPYVSPNLMGDIIIKMLFNRLHIYYSDLINQTRLRKL